MMGIIALLVTVGMEIGILIYCLITNDNQYFKKHCIRLGAFLLFCILTVVQVLQWGFRWEPLLIVSFIQAIIGVVYLVRKRKPNKPFKKSRVILVCVRYCLAFIFAVMPAIVFPQYKPLPVTGQYAVESTSYTVTDPHRIETYTDTGENRKVSMQFWYPKTDNANETFPLVVFSHGSFGYRGSNYSTFMDLASNGYVVCSIDHTYQSFFTKQTDGKSIIVNNDFLNQAIAVQSSDTKDQDEYDLTHQWMKLRTDDMHLVINSILENTQKADADTVYHAIDTTTIGLFGHSIGGASAAQLGREREDIDAVIVLDGTMIGEEIGFSDGKTVLNAEPYPVPLFNVYNEEHYEEAKKEAETYNNTFATAHAVDARQTVFMGAGHLNFTDLPMFSPTLAKMLGTGSINSRYCIETMNAVVLNYFNYYLKHTGTLNIANQY